MERKLLLLHDVAQLCRTQHNRLVREQRAACVVASDGVSSRLYHGGRGVHAAHATPPTGVTVQVTTAVCPYRCLGRTKLRSRCRLLGCFFIRNPTAGGEGSCCSHHRTSHPVFLHRHAQPLTAGRSTAPRLRTTAAPHSAVTVFTAAASLLLLLGTLTTAVSSSTIHDGFFWIVAADVATAVASTRVSTSRAAGTILMPPGS